MVKRMEMVAKKKRLGCLVGHLGAVALMLLMTSPAHAQGIPVMDLDVEINTGFIMDAIGLPGAGPFTPGTVLNYLANINDILDAEFGEADAVSIGDQTVTAMSAQVMADTIDNNARTNTWVAEDEKIAVNSKLPPNGIGGQFSKCAVSQAARAKTSEKKLLSSAAHALAASAANRPSGTAAISADLSAEMKLGLIPCTSASDPDALTAQKLGCANLNTNAWADKFEGFSRTMAIIFDNLQFPVPPAFVESIKRGTYQPLPSPASIAGATTPDQYMPFIAAYNYCQHLTPRRSVAPNANTADAVMALENYTDITPEAHQALDECMWLIVERAQYGNNMTKGVNQSIYGLQYTRCVDDAEAGIIDDPSDCKVNGRSYLQAMHDSAYRMASQGYDTGYLSGADRPTFMGEQRTALADQAAFDAYVEKERATLTQAIVAMKSGAAGVNVSPMTAIVK